MYKKRKTIKKTWPVQRKGTKYIVVPSEKGIPLLVALRDMLKFGENKKEIKKILNLGVVSVNGKVVKEKKTALKLFDIIKLKDKFYKLNIKDRKYCLESIDLKDSKKKVVKIIGKKLIKGEKQQVNLSDGRNYLTDKKCSVGDSVEIDLEENKIIDLIELKEKTRVFVFEGKHIGKSGVIEKIHNKLAEIRTDSEKINVKLESLVGLK